jgi:hypothetical protein
MVSTLKYTYYRISLRRLKVVEEKTTADQHSEKTMKRADFCMNKCTACKLARKKEKGFWFWLVKLEAGMCPMCRAYKKVYGVPAYQKPARS